MPELKILIADDEYLARQAIKLALPGGHNYSISEAESGDEAIAHMQRSRPDLIFLDIQMPVQTGMQVLRALPGGYTPYVVIVSAYDDYAVEAFEYRAADYLLKPFTQERFDKALQRALTQMEEKSAAGGLAQLLERWVAVDHLPKGRAGYKERLSVKEGERVIVVPCADIQYLQADGEYTALHTTGRKYLHNSTLSALGDELDPKIFARIHRSVIVNVGSIAELRSQHNGDYTVLLKSGAELKLSRNYRTELMQLIG